MEPTKAQKNSALINDLKGIREDIAKLKQRIETNHSSRETSIILTLLQEVDHHAVDRMLELGLTMKLEDSKEQ